MRQWMRERQQLLWMLGAIVFGITIFGWWFLRQPTNKNTASAPLAFLSLEKSMKAHPRWGYFEQLGKDIKLLEERLKSLGVLPENQPNEADSNRLQNLPMTMSDRMLLNSEIEMHMELMADAQRRWEQDMRDEINNQLKMKEEQLQAEIKAEVYEKQRLYKEKLEDYKDDVDLEHSLKLTNIDFKLKVPGLSEAEKLGLENEKAAIQRTMQEMIKAKEAEYAKELKEFVDHRSAEAKKVLDEYLRQLQVDAQKRLELKQKKMKQEFLDWQKQQLDKHRQSLESKKRRYSAEINQLESLRAEQELVRVRMKADIRKKLRELTEKQGISAVVLNPLFGSQPFDITSELIQLLR